MANSNFPRFVFVVVLILCCASLIYPQTPAVKQPAKEKIRIGWSIGDMRLERWQTDCEAFQQRAEASA